MYNNFNFYNVQKAIGAAVVAVRGSKPPSSKPIPLQPGCEAQRA